MGTIAVSNLGKAFKQYPDRWSRLAEWVIPGHRSRHNLKWVLKDINFEIGSGEAVGVIGINGAGKSTLLKMITGNTQPTTGHVQVIGRLAAMLELGMGFHPDFTGRQNAIMAGQLLGFDTAAMVSAMPEIEAFSEIGDYLDQPVRVYSSGMQVRLAFSVATAFRPDILVVDEALSVGDVYFQHKSFERIREFRRQGTTLLLVSHDKSAIQSICDRAILLNAGRLAAQGDPEQVMDYYNALLAGHQNQTVTQRVAKDGSIQTVSGTGQATVKHLSLLNAEGQPIEVVDVGQPVTLRVEVQAHADIETLVLGYGIKNRLGQVIYGTNTQLKGQALSYVSNADRWLFEIAFPMNLGPGSYSVQTALCSSDTHLEDNYEWRDLALVFTVVNIDKPAFDGVAWIDPTISISRL